MAFVLAIAVALVAPAGAAADFSFGPGSVTYARVAATHGYRVNFSENDKGYFFVRVKGHGATTDFATHTAPGPGDQLVGDFGRRGKFDLRFVALGRARRVPAGNICRGKPGTWQAGYLVGSGHFHTERGFARIDVHRVPAARESWSRLTCDLDGVPLPGHPKEEKATFGASVSEPPVNVFSLKTPKRVLKFHATEFYRHARPADARVMFVAELNERAGRISVHRRVLARAGERSLLFVGGPQLPEELEVKPPLPFSGTGDFLRTPESTFTWSGDLAVRFPGLGKLRLAGPRFAAVLCEAKGCLLRQAEASSASARRARASVASTPMLSR